MAAVELGVFVIPDAAGRDAVIEQVTLADRVGIDLIGIQDHPYQRRFLESMTLLALCAAGTPPLRPFPDAANLSLRAAAGRPHGAGAVRPPRRPRRRLRRRGRGASSAV